MARDGTGIRKASESSIQIEFTYQGETCRERIKLKPTTANLNRATLHRHAIIDAINNGTFNYLETFPNSKNARKFSESTELTTGQWLDKWLDRKEKHIKTSTYVGYEKIINAMLRSAIKRTLNFDFNHKPRRFIASPGANCYV